MSVSERETVFWFGKHKGKDLSEVPSGYLRWMVENIDPKPLPKDVAGKTLDEAQAMEDRMRHFINAAELELEEREIRDEQR
jgi:uncharacterized protein (DUF3820 family)